MLYKLQTVPLRACFFTGLAFPSESNRVAFPPDIIIIVQLGCSAMRAGSGFLRNTVFESFYTFPHTFPLSWFYSLRFAVLRLISEDKISSYARQPGLIVVVWTDDMGNSHIEFVSSVVDMPKAGMVIASGFLAASVGKLLSGPAIKPILIKHRFAAGR